jgi:hypothetical protein
MQRLIGRRQASQCRRPGSVRGAWLQDGYVNNLSFFSPADAQRPTADRLDRFEAVARAIRNNLPH